MKTKLLVFLLCLSSLGVMGQGTITRKKKETTTQTTSKPKTTAKPESAAKPATTSNPKPADATGYDVTFTCNIPTASLYIDGIHYGTASGSRFLKTGFHSIKLESIDCLELSDSIFVDSNHKSFSYTMQKKEQSQPVVEEAITEQEEENDADEQNKPELKLSLADIKNLQVEPEVYSAIINGNKFYYSICSTNPDLAIIVAKKGAYNDLKEVILPETVQAENGNTITIIGIDKKAFYKCKKIRRVIFPSSVCYIGELAFARCNVEEILFSEGLISIGDGAFADNNLLDIELPEGLEEIGSSAFFAFKTTVFSRARNGKLYIPKTVSNIGGHAFAMTRNGYGMWFNSKRDILCLPDYVNLENCKDIGISRDPVEEYLSKK